jgi:Lamin Tail Domain
MKAIFKLFPVWLFIVLSTLLSPLKADAQGRILINEYMPWPGNACGTPSEFIELLNMGPGPMNIGCYILTDGDFSVTIPPGTILQPGQFYVIAGQDFLPSPCTNINMNVTADLNWTTCNCTSGPIPSFGGGFLTDGGSANEQLVLLGPALEVIDAVARNMPVETSVDITTANL